jgi:hypothetical protein
MRQKNIIIYFIILVLLILILTYYFLYNIYGDEVRKQPGNLFADVSSTMSIQIVPINALGWKAIFRKSSASFEILEGNELIDILSIDKLNGEIKIQSKGKDGVVMIKIQSEHSLLPEYVEVQILPLNA